MSKTSLRSLLHQSKPPVNTNAAPHEVSSISQQNSPSAVGRSNLPEPVSRSRGSQRTWMWSSVPALLLLALVAGTKDNAPIIVKVVNVASEASTTTSGSIADGILLSSQTLVVTPKRLSGYVLQAKLQPTSSVIGQAPLSGQIARVLVRPGQRVSVNDRVLELSTGAPSRPSRRSERMQDSAEAAQIEAVRQQEALNSKMQNAHAELHQAQLRVAAAKRRVGQAREIVKKLQRGESVRVPSSASAESTPSRKRSARRQNIDGNASTSAARRDAMREAQKAKRAVAQAEDKLSKVRAAVKQADQQVRDKGVAMDRASTTADKVQEDFEAGQAKGSDVATARAALATAKSEYEAAEALAGEAHHAIEQVQASIENLQADAQRASSRAVRLAAAAKSSAKVEDTTEALPERTAEPDNKHNDLTQAVEFVRQSIAESEDAAKDAERIKNQIDDYERQVNRTRERLDSTGKALEAAQEQMLDRDIRARLSSVRAPATGVVLSVAEIARDVSPGDPVVTIGRTDLLEARFADYSQAWKSLKKGMLLPAMVSEADAKDSDTTDKASSAGKGGTPAQPNTATPTGASDPATSSDKPADSISTMVRVHSVKAPERPGAPAILRVRILNPRVPVALSTRRISRRQFRTGMTVVCSLTPPQQHEVLSVPVSAILPASDGSHMVAVLKPVGTAAVTATTESATPQSVSSQEAAGQNPQPTPQVQQATDNAEGAHRVEWRPVTLGKAEGQQQEIVDGLLPGERIALTPLALHQFEARHGSSTPVRLEFTS